MSTIFDLYLKTLKSNQVLPVSQINEGFIDDFIENKFKEIERDGVGKAGTTFFGMYLNKIHKKNKNKCYDKLTGDTDIERKISFYQCLAKSASTVISEINRQMNLTSNIKDGEDRAKTRKNILNYYKKWLLKYVKYQKKYQDLLQDKYDLEKHSKDLLG